MYIQAHCISQAHVYLAFLLAYAFLKSARCKSQYPNFYFCTFSGAQYIICFLVFQFASQRSRLSWSLPTLSKTSACVVLDKQSNVPSLILPFQKVQQLVFESWIAPTCNRILPFNFCISTLKRYMWHCYPTIW